MHARRRRLAGVLGAALLGACGDGPPAPPVGPPDWPEALEELAQEARATYAVPSVLPEAARLLGGDPLFVDVRTAEEVAVSALPGARALTDDAARTAFLAERSSRPIVVYCTAGLRSGAFTRELRAAGLVAWNLDGGICAWASSGFDLVDASGQPTRRIHCYDEDFEDCVPEGYDAVD